METGVLCLSADLVIAEITAYRPRSGSLEDLARAGEHTSAALWSALAAWIHSVAMAGLPVAFCIAVCPLPMMGLAPIAREVSLGKG